MFINEANYWRKCDDTQPFGCPAGQSAYHGRGPIQLSWNYNYKAAGDALGVDLLRNPWLVQNDSVIAWKTARSSTRQEPPVGPCSSRRPARRSPTSASTSAR